MREYHLRPWEVDELTLTECSVMLLALHDQGDDGGSLTSKDGDELMQREDFQSKLQRLFRENQEFNNLPPDERARIKMADALRKR